MSKVFLSHSNKDKDSVRRLAKDLRELGINIWFDEWEIHVGDSITQKINAGIDACDFVAIWITKSALDSGWVQSEWNAKFSDEISAQKTMVLPLLAESAELPALLQDKKYADFRDDYQEGLRQLLAVSGLAPVGLSTNSRVLFLIAGPSGVGKDVVQNRVHFLLQTHGIPTQHLQKYTTRTRRPDEKLKSKYIHLSEDKFQRQIDEGTIGCAHPFDEGTIGRAHPSSTNMYGCDAHFCPNALPGSAILYNIRNLQALDDITESAVACGLVVRKILLTADVDSLLNRINQRFAPDAEKATRAETARADVGFVNRTLPRLRDTFDLIVDNSDGSPLRDTLEQVLSFIVGAVRPSRTSNDT